METEASDVPVVIDLWNDLTANEKSHLKAIFMNFNIPVEAIGVVSTETAKRAIKVAVGWESCAACNSLLKKFDELATVTRRL